ERGCDELRSGQDHARPEEAFETAQRDERVQRVPDDVPAHTRPLVAGHALERFLGRVVDSHPRAVTGLSATGQVGAARGYLFDAAGDAAGAFSDALYDGAGDATGLVRAPGCDSFQWIARAFGEVALA